jgi:hypothetical protein
MCSGMAGMQPGELAVIFPACPLPGNLENFPDDIK